MGERSSESSGRDVRIRRFVDAIVEGLDVDPTRAHELRQDFTDHITDAADALERDGLSRDDAIEEALRRFGSPADLRARLAASQRARGPRGGTGRAGVGDGWRSLMRAARLSLRSARRRPLVPAAVSLTVAVGIGATTTVSAVVAKVLLESPPFPDPDALVVLTDERGGFGVTSPAHYLDIRAQSGGSFSALAAYAPASVVVTTPDAVERADAVQVSWNYFEALGTRPARGVAFRSGDELGDDPVAIVSHDLWIERLGAAEPPQTLTVDGVSTRVVGVMPDGFRLHRDVDLWLPLTLVAEEASRGSNFLFLVGRLADGATLTTAQAQLAVISERLREAHPRFFSAAPLRVRGLHEASTAGVATRLKLLATAMTLVLLLVCANVGSLLAARTELRRSELALRFALGAPRLDIVRLVAVDTLLWVGIGSVLGGFIAAQAVSALGSLAPPGLPRADELTLDARMLLIGLAAALVTAALVATPLVWSVPRRGPAAAGRSARTGSRTHLRRVAVVLQVAGSLVLVVHAGLLVRSFQSLRGVDPGLDVENLITAQVTLAGSGFENPASRWAYFRTAIDWIERVPGVSRATAGTFRPTSGGFTRRFALSDRPPPPDDAYLFATFDPVAPGYFETLRIPLRSGRALEPADAADGQPVAVVNEAFAQAYFPSSDPIGVRLGFYVDGEPRTDQFEIVGVVGNVRSDALASNARPAIYLPLSMSPMPSGTFFVRVDPDDPGLGGRLRAAFGEVAPSQPVHSVRPMSEVLAASIERDRLLTLMVSSFAGVALVLALSGVFGLTAFVVGRRTREFGVRIAVGARPEEVAARALGDGLTPVALGIVLGWPGAGATARLVRDALFEVPVFDLPTYALSTAALVVAATLAVLLPARRAGSIDPLEAIRND